jgi:hypothetical protein
MSMGNLHLGKDLLKLFTRASIPSTERHEVAAFHAVILFRLTYVHSRGFEPLLPDELSNIAECKKSLVQGQVRYLQPVLSIGTTQI